LVLGWKVGLAKGARGARGVEGAKAKDAEGLKGEAQAVEAIAVSGCWVVEREAREARKTERSRHQAAIHLHALLIALSLLRLCTPGNDQSNM
ncbi:MAG: hypothetical protein ACJ78Q_15135, partial [Chloroflexia bacterium]